MHGPSAKAKLQFAMPFSIKQLRINHRSKGEPVMVALGAACHRICPVSKRKGIPSNFAILQVPRATRPPTWKPIARPASKQLDRKATEFLTRADLVKSGFEALHQSWLPLTPKFLILQA